MKITQTKAEGLKRVFNVAASPEEVAAKLEQHLLEVGKTAKVPGFRPGHIPLSMLKARFTGRVIQDVLGECVDEGIREAFKQHDIQPAIRPLVDVEKYNEKKDFLFSIEVEVLPEIKPLEPKDLSFERLVVDLTDKDVETTLEEIAEKHVRTEPAPKGYQAKEGDVLYSAMRAWIGKEPLEIHSHDEIHIRLGSEQFDPAMHKQLMGAIAGEDREVTVTYPKEARHADIAGKTVRYEIAVHDVMQPQKVAINDKLASEKGLKDLDELTTRVREELNRRFNDASFWHVKRQILDDLAKKYDFEIPPTLLEKEIESIKASDDLDDHSDEEPQKLDKKDQEKPDKEIADLAERRVRLGLLLAQIGRDHEITVAQNELTQVLLEQVRQYPGQEAQVIEYYQNNPEAMAALKAPVLENKIIEYILAHAKVKEKKVSTETFSKAFEEISN